MIEINQKYPLLDTDIITILDNYQIFRYDEYPILFTGTNKYGVRILGSFAEEDDETDLFRYLYMHISSRQYQDFLQRKTSYLDVIRDNKQFYFVEEDINKRVSAVFQVPADEFPDEYLPSNESFCPEYVAAGSLTYSFSLKGLLANAHLAVAESIAVVTKSIGQVFESILAPVSVHQFQPTAHLAPNSIGSFRINFTIDAYWGNQIPIFFLFNENKAFDLYVHTFLEYSLTTLIDEAHRFSENLYGTIPDDTSSLIGELSVSKYDTKLLKARDDFYDSIYRRKSELDDRKLSYAVVKVAESLLAVTSEIGNGFSHIEVIELTDKGDEYQLGLIDKDFAEDIELFVTKIEDHSDSVFEDEEYNTYSIQVYNLNTDTGKGSAYVINKYDSSILDRCRIKIETDFSVANSIFTESLHLSKFIEVTGRAKLSKGKFVSMSVQYNG